jgi:hypothetical protein
VAGNAHEYCAKHLISRISAKLTTAIIAAKSLPWLERWAGIQGFDELKTYPPLDSRFRGNDGDFSVSQSA